MEKSNKGKKDTTPSLYSDLGHHMGTLSIEEIKAISKTWSKNEWEAYLSTLEGELKEENIEDQSQIENLSADGYADSVFAMIQTDTLAHLPNVQRALRRILSTHLTKLEHEVIWLTYWDNLTQRQIADRLKISRWNVRRRLFNAQEKISHSLFKESLKRSKHFKDLKIGGV